MEGYIILGKKEIEQIKKTRDYFERDIHYFKKNKLRTYLAIKREKKVINYIKNFLKEKDNNKITALDVGCHLGKYSKTLSKLGIETYGIDISLPVLRLVNSLEDKNKNEHYIHMSITHLGFKKKSFNIILCIDLLHHFDDEMVKVILKDLLNLVKDDGICIFDIKNKFNPLIFSAYKFSKKEILLRARTLQWFTKVLKSNSFKIIHKSGVIMPLAYIDPCILVCCKRDNF